jgi:nucleoside-diphosphate-sugar epimerase
MKDSYTVFGATGFIGQHLADALRSSGLPVWCPDRSELHSLAKKDLGHVFYSLGGDNWAKDPFGAIDAHLTHLRRLLEGCDFQSLTYISSTRLYLGASGGREDCPLVVDYKDPGRFHNALKLAGETLCLASERPEVRIARLSNVIGFAPRGISLIPVLIKDAILTGEMKLWTAPDSAKDYIAIEDVVDILPRISKSAKKRLYNVASGKNITAASVVSCIEDITGAKAKWHKGEAVIFPAISIDRIQKEFQFEPRLALDVLPGVCGKFKDAFSKTGVLT